MNNIKIFDTSTIVCIFQEAQYPKIFDNCIKRKYQLVIPDYVFDEIKENINTYSSFKKYQSYFMIKSSNENYFNFLVTRYPRLHKGEIGVISLGLEYNRTNNRFVCLLDDNYARDISKKLHLRTAGIIGFALWEKENGDICYSDCETIHKNISQSKFRLSNDILDRLIK